jgi:hypothetical protein
MGKNIGAESNPENGERHERKVKPLSGFLTMEFVLMPQTPA